MKKLLCGTLAVLLLAGCTPRPEKGDAKHQLATLVSKVEARLGQGAQTEAELAGELKEFDALLAEHKGEKTEDVAEILRMKAGLYFQIFEKPEKAVVLLRQIQTDFPGTPLAKEIPGMITAVEEQAEAGKIARALAVGTTFPAFAVKDLDGQPLSVAGTGAKVVLLDFWATWCGPCVAELPNVTKAYDKYHPQGFAIIGISLDDSRPTLAAFLKDNKMAWPQFFDGKGWENELAVKYGVHSIPCTYLLDRTGKIIGKNLRGEALNKALEKALAP